MENKEYGCCPECGSKRVVKLGFTWSGRTHKQQYRCQDCGRLTIKPVQPENIRELEVKSA